MFLLLVVPATLAQSGERRSLIQDLVSKIRSSPSHNSLSPSFNGERKFDVIGVSLSHGFFFFWLGNQQIQTICMYVCIKFQFNQFGFFKVPFLIPTFGAHYPCPVV